MAQEIGGEIEKKQGRQELVVNCDNFGLTGDLISIT